MEIPNTPVEFLQRCLYAELEGLPEGSIVSLPAQNLRNLVEGYADALELISHQQELINAFVENS
tara:strand:+ start:340 stop:531 length:192 start_codon:yes stop_codon:yes gene_type:complete